MGIHEYEFEKYETIWRDVPDYKILSPGEDNVKRFMNIIIPRQQAFLIDIGCGTGRAGLRFAEHGLDVTWLDLTSEGLDEAVPRRRFIQAALWENWEHRYKHGFDYGYCCDVMEHIPTEYTMLVVDRILSACRTTWFQIALLPDQFGEEIGQTLHLTVRPFNWWLDRLQTIGDVIDARDLCGQALYIVRSK